LQDQTLRKLQAQCACRLGVDDKLAVCRHLCRKGRRRCAMRWLLTCVAVVPNRTRAGTARVGPQMSNPPEACTGGGLLIIRWQRRRRWRAVKS
jgi:hypothetical protein